MRTPTLTFSLPSPSLVLWVSIQTLVHARVAFSLGRCIIRITPIWSKLTKSLHPFSRQVMGDISGGRVGIAILFRPSIIWCPTTRFTRGRAKGFGKVSWPGFDRDVSFGEIFWWQSYVSLPSAAPAGQWKCVSEFLQPPQTEERWDIRSGREAAHK